jgi:hypothetical protein
VLINIGERPCDCESVPGRQQDAEDLGLPRGSLVVRPASGQTVYRVLGRSEPREWDFYSDRDKGRDRAPRQDFIDFVAISVFGSQAAALANCTRFPKLVAEVLLSPRNGFTIARTFADIDEHYSVWGDPEALRNHLRHALRRERRHSRHV